MKNIWQMLDRRMLAGVLLVVVIGLLGRCTLQPNDPRLALTPLPGQTAMIAGTRFAATAQAGQPTAAQTAQPTPRATRATTPIPPQLPEVTPPPGGEVFVLTPAAGAVGWTSNTEPTGNNFEDYNIYAGVYRQRVHVGAMLFDLSPVAPGAPILYADLSLTGLTETYRAADGAWTVELLGPWLDQAFSAKGFADVSPAYASFATVGTLAAADLRRGRTNTLVLPPEALAELAARVFSKRVSLRIQGPESPADNLFSWDSGYGQYSVYSGPILRVVAGPAPAVRPPSPTPRLVIVTAPPPSPTPGNVLTAAVAAGQSQTGKAATATRLPPNWVTPVVITPTPTPENSATASRHAALLTAEAIVNGTPTPLPVNVWTATATPTYVVVTLTPTPATFAEALARAQAEATRRAVEGPPTPLPPNVVTATPEMVVVASAPTPQNAATSQAALVQATISALLYGTATPTPANWATTTATPPLPLLVPLALVTPTPSLLGPALASDPAEIPASLRGRILFASDRFGQAALFVMNPDGSNVEWLTRTYPYSLARAREGVAPDGVRRVSVEPDLDTQPQIFLFDPRYNVRRSVTAMKGWAYDAAWSPVADRIVFVSSEPGNDEIYTINVDGSGLQRLTSNGWEWDKHPSWSPDGQRIVFFSNRDTGRRQIWIMNADGSSPRRVSDGLHDDWDPIWVK